jgi:hypothetical protein
MRSVVGGPFARKAQPVEFLEHPRTSPKIRRRRALAKDPRAGEELWRLAKRVEIGDLAEALRALALLKLRLAQAEDQLIVLARRRGWPWWTIAWRLGVSDQAVYGRYKRISASSSTRT